MFTRPCSPVHVHHSPIGDRHSEICPFAKFPCDDAMDIEKCKCHYEILGVEVGATVEEIKRSYKRIILQYHPDKNSHLEEEEKSRCTNIFRRIQEAYECLTDEKKRKWYDQNRRRIIGGGPEYENGKNATGKEEEKKRRHVSEINIWEYFTSSCYEGYDDKNEKSFYNVYRKLFEQIVKEENDELRWGSNRRTENITAPSFGDSNMTGKDIDMFYEYWSNFNTVKKFSHTYDYMKYFDMENRNVRRSLKKVGDKKSIKERKEYNENIRSLVNHLKKFDNRYINRVIEIAEEKRKKAIEKENLKKEQILRRKLLLESCNAKREFSHEDETYTQEEAQKVPNNYTRTTPNDHHAYTTTPKGREESSCEMDFNHHEDDDEAINVGKVIYRCEVCRKNFKSMKQYSSHEKSKKHIANFLKNASKYELRSIFQAGEPDQGRPRECAVEQEGKRVEEQAEEQAEEQSNEQDGERAEEQTEGQSNEQDGERAEEQTEEQAEEQAEKQAEEQTEEQTEELSEELSEEQAEELGGGAKAWAESENDSPGERSDASDDLLSWYRSNRRGRNQFMNVGGDEKGENNSVKLDGDVSDSSDDYTTPKRKKKAMKKKKKKEGGKTSKCERKLSPERNAHCKERGGSSRVNIKLKDDVKILQCKMCKQSFDSRNKLFEHIQAEGHAANKEVESRPKANKGRKK
ncbi:DnaJ protein, putative [Plasmodium ovale wallikeri]|uniref:DnaJ protein, putative n=1 Tax=Plasmodium ovale wallikeri TaxID=864142 RepID=A0A1A8YS25_PLAOA|nr:DnaJ protein, putative [Plasmodium ovale wallikeri]SBT34443.1 DnaJ protein, putative [Plasmodium ovale wallikeri]